MSSQVGALLLAAGFSRRFGGVKLLAELADGQTVFAQTLGRIRAVIADTLVVTRPELAGALSRFDCPLTVFAGAEQGMGASLGHGISVVRQRGWDGCLVCLADMPFIASATYRHIAAASRPDNIVVPMYRDQAGQPVAFGSRFFQPLTGLSGDRGGKAVLQQHAAHVLHLPVADQGIVKDIDTPQDLSPRQTGK